MTKKNDEIILYILIVAAILYAVYAWQDKLSPTQLANMEKYGITEKNLRELEDQNLNLQRENKIMAEPENMAEAAAEYQTDVVRLEAAAKALTRRIEEAHMQHTAAAENIDYWDSTEMDYTSWCDEILDSYDEYKGKNLNRRDLGICEGGKTDEYKLKKEPLTWEESYNKVNKYDDPLLSGSGGGLR